MADKCKDCLNSLTIISENGYSVRCTLSEKKSLDCLMGAESHFVSLIKLQKEGD